MAKQLISSSETKCVYRDGDLAIKEFCEGFPKAEVLNEALCTARVEDLPGLHVPKVLSVSVMDGKWSITREFIEGKTLQQLMDENPDKVQEYMDRLSIAASTMEKLARFLSGGTQQKVVIAKWLMSKSRVFIFDEPTRGIDVGAKSSIYELMDELVLQGAAILMVSSDLQEILGMSDRIYVMSGGSVVGEIDGSEVEQSMVLNLAFSNV